jgi:hypothetical protein
MRAGRKHFSFMLCGVLWLLAADAWSATAVTLLTLDGELRSVPMGREPATRRLGLAEGGQGVIVDEYAVVSGSSRGPKILVASEAFSPSGDELRTIETKLAAAPFAKVDTTNAPASELGSAATRLEGLVVTHQQAHSPNHNWTPTPLIAFVPQRVAATAGNLDGRKGFAIVTFGETGQVLSVKLLDNTGEQNIPALQESIAAGIRSTFLDERRHDHTAYIAYKVTGQFVSQSGNGLVSLPMCCPCPRPCP